MTHLRRKFTSAAILAALLMSPAALVQAEEGSMGSLTTTTASSTETSSSSEATAESSSSSTATTTSGTETGQATTATATVDQASFQADGINSASFTFSGKATLPEGATAGDHRVEITTRTTKVVMGYAEIKEDGTYTLVVEGSELDRRGFRLSLPQENPDATLLTIQEAFTARVIKASEVGDLPVLPTATGIPSELTGVGIRFAGLFLVNGNTHDEDKLSLAYDISNPDKHNLSGYKLRLSVLVPGQETPVEIGLSDVKVDSEKPDKASGEFNFVTGEVKSKIGDSFFEEDGTLDTDKLEAATKIELIKTDTPAAATETSTTPSSSESTPASSTADVKQADRKEPVNTGAGIDAVAGPLAAVLGALTAGAGAVIGTRKRK